MPELSRFYGIVVRMYYGDHPPPHFHASYAGATATIDIDTLSVIAGKLPARALGLAIEWAAIHQEERGVSKSVAIGSARKDCTANVMSLSQESQTQGLNKQG
jgi:hypothetical protein